MAAVGRGSGPLDGPDGCAAIPKTRAVDGLPALDGAPAGRADAVARVGAAASDSSGVAEEAGAVKKNSSFRKDQTRGTWVRSDARDTLIRAESKTSSAVRPGERISLSSSETNKLLPSRSAFFFAEQLVVACAGTRWHRVNDAPERRQRTLVFSAVTISSMILLGTAE